MATLRPTVSPDKAGAYDEERDKNHYLSAQADDNDFTDGSSGDYSSIDPDSGVKRGLATRHIRSVVVWSLAKTGDTLLTWLVTLTVCSPWQGSSDQDCKQISLLVSSCFSKRSTDPRVSLINHLSGSSVPEAPWLLEVQPPS
jgi:hypothetical protein